jgi:hypothetical protein
MGTKSNRKRNKSHRLPHSGMHSNKRTSTATRRRARRITGRLPIHKKPHFMHPRIEDETISSLTSNTNSNYSKNSSEMSIINPSNSFSEESSLMTDMQDTGLARGKTRTRKNRKGRGSQRGGTCYGRGVGANSYDPNFSIYNTRELQLFPYKPTN